MTPDEDRRPPVPHHGRPPATPTTLARRLGTGDAVVLGLASMLGAGVFGAFGPATAAAGGGLLVALAVAGLVATANATSSAQLAAQYPTSGGTYVYGRERLGPTAGFVAGWSFVVGKTASCAAMALTVAAYLVPAPAQRPVAALLVAALTGLTCAGITRTARASRLLVTLVLLALVAVVVTALAGPAAHGPVLDVTGSGALGVLQGAGLLFFAFAGFARLATMGEEVRDPERTIPRAVVTALALVLAVYAVVALALLHALGVDGLAGAPAPLLTVAAEGSAGLPVLVRIGAAAGALGALLALMTGIGRTTLAMARGADLPRTLAAVHPRSQVPVRAQLVLGGLVVVLVLVTDLRGALGASSAGVLLYYAVANAAALTQDRAHRRFPRPLAAVGLVGCLVLVATLPAYALLVALAVVLAGLGGRALVGRARSRTP
ncbi:APC family permease [Cellulomonas marina]|uniref:Basic amino acid/polyamine antiporter, APA family n=1 Tax=Cellulomonas marina TaxID=988821 RepID=A0A1I0X572_9CELL|nr:APC family permease [Cellulomonas marina]GIG28958.1 conserved hypothetical transport protein [Cellulomonas marina]SFA96135.1 basic amino acid/polyamine antiporter, APA family [Cellulomonas marina]